MLEQHQEKLPDEVTQIRVAETMPAEYRGLERPEMRAGH